MARASQLVELRVRGMVQGVGFRPMVWRLATELNLTGEVCNDAEGVLIRLTGRRETIDQFRYRLAPEAPALARIDAIEEVAARPHPAFNGFRIAASRPGTLATPIVPDAATCSECLAELLNPRDRRFRYAFTNCVHCGPRLSIIEGMPYDRPNTAMNAFPMCEACASEYGNPIDRRFHAQPIACPLCGPRLRLTAMDGTPLAQDLSADPIAAAVTLVGRGNIVALKGLGGFHLACDATSEEAVMRLRQRKRRDGKAFAVMIRDIDAVRSYCQVSPLEEKLLLAPEAPILLLEQSAGSRVPSAVAPGLATIGVMLPYTPMHHLLMRDFTKPMVMTSGNLSDEPQCTDGAEARSRLGAIADYCLDHDRQIVNRIDDSVMRVMAGRPAILRRGRGFAPAPLPLPDGFEDAPPVLALGGEAKSTFCLVRNSQAVLSQHLGDLEHAPTFDEYRRTLDHHLKLFDHTPSVLAIDCHPEYLSSKLGENLAEERGLALAKVQHHHAHIAACLAESGIPRDAGPFLGIALDGLGLGGDDTVWGCEFLLTDYRNYRRVGSLRPVAMPGGAQAIREPWRNTLAQILNTMTWSEFEARSSGTALHAMLTAKPVTAIASMIRSGTSAPLASSCGRLFDAVAGAIGIAPDRLSYEGEAAARLEALVDPMLLAAMPPHAGYSFGVSGQSQRDLLRLEPDRMWQSLLGDLATGTPAAIIAARFHKGLAVAVGELALDLLKRETSAVPGIVALSGGCFQNKLLLEEVKGRLEADQIRVLIHAKVPSNDGGLSLGQAVVAAARSIAANPMD